MSQWNQIRPLSTMTDNVRSPMQMGGSGSPAELSASTAQRLLVLNEMTGRVVHDFRNILSVIDSALRLAESNVSDPEKVRAYTFPAHAMESSAEFG
jgi:hypothetical protein